MANTRPSHSYNKATFDSISVWINDCKHVLIDMIDLLEEWRKKKLPPWNTILDLPNSPPPPPTFSVINRQKERKSHKRIFPRRFSTREKCWLGRISIIDSIWINHVIAMESVKKNTNFSNNTIQLDFRPHCVCHSICSSPFRSSRRWMLQVLAAAACSRYDKLFD